MRGLSYPVALEAAVKIQEVSYIHAEGLAGGELKHYAIALIEPGTPCIALVPDDETRHEIPTPGARRTRACGQLHLPPPLPGEAVIVHGEPLCPGGPRRG